MKNRKNIKDFVWNAVGLTLNSFNSLFFLIVVRYINGMDEAGIFTYAFSLCTLFYVFSCFYNRTFQVAENTNKYNFNDFLSTRFVLGAATLCLILIFAIINGFSCLKIFVILFLMIFRVAEAISECLYGELQKQDRLYKTGISLTLKAVFGLGLFALIDLLTKNLLLSIFGIIFANILVIVFYDRKNIKEKVKEKFRFQKKNIRSILKISLPVMVFTALGAYLANCPKYFMTYFTDNEMQMVFGILIMPASVLTLASAYLINPFISKLIKLKEEKRLSEFKKTTVSILLVMAGIGLLAVGVCYLIGIPVLNFIYNLNLENYLGLLILGVVAAVFYAMTNIISGFLTVLNENKIQTVIYAATSIFATIITFFQTMKSGMDGAIMAYLFVSILLLSLYIITFIRKLRNVNK